MRILFVSNSGFQYLHSVLPVLERRGATYRQLATNDLKVHQKRLANSGIRAVRNYYFDEAFLNAYRAVLADFAPDILHVTGVRSTLIKTLAAVRSFPNIRVVHERISIGGLNAASPLDWALFRNPRLDRIVMPSYAMLNHLMGNALTRAMIGSRSDVLHYAVDLPPPTSDEARRAMRQRLGLEEDAFVIGTVCWMRPLKNVHFIAEVVASLPKDANVQLAVIGTPYRKQDYMDALRKAGGDRLKLLGRIDGARDLMPAFDLYATPTSLPGESFGFAFAEAMAHGIPSLAMSFGAPAELCEPGLSGLALPDDAEAWRHAILDLMNDPARRAAIGAAARQRIAGYFAPERVADDYLAVYRSLMP